jgi:hypothetical protein
MWSSIGFVDTTLEIREVLVALARRYAFRELAFLIGGGVTGPALSQRELARLQQLCAYGQRLMELDGEDLDKPDAAYGASTDTTFAILVGTEMVPLSLVARGALCHIRQQPVESATDALVSLHPTFRLLLEVLQIRWDRHDTLWLISGAHIAGEYAPMLAWQPYLGHAGDPLRLRLDPAFTGPDSRWGHLDDSACPRPKPEKAAAARSLRVADEPASGWRAYLGRQDSIVSRTLAGCATDCSQPCAVMTQFNGDDQAHLSEACRIALAYQASALVRLRHRAPVGHGFGVPSRDEVAEAWDRSRHGIAKRGGLGEAALADDGFPLPGLPSLFSAIAGAPLEPDTVVHDTMNEVIRGLDPEGLVW